jgi:hypothetical protein
MVWGGIGLNYRTQLVLVDEIIDAEKYTEIFTINGVSEHLHQSLGKSAFFLQQDNAKPHKALHTLHTFNQFEIPLVPNWPPKSPELNPIEHVWDFLENDVRGIRITTQSQLDDIRVNAWNNCQTDVLNNYHQSFKARLQVCLRHRGNCLNGYWKEVHDLHHS